VDKCGHNNITSEKANAARIAPGTYISRSALEKLTTAAFFSLLRSINFVF